MKLYLASLGAGILVGVVYSLLSVRSPAPPIVALLGLLGILIGEQVLPIAKHILAGSALADAIHRSDSKSHVMGHLPANSEVLNRRSAGSRTSGAEKSDLDGAGH